MESVKKRLVWTLTILVFFFILLAARTGYIQVFQGEHYARKAVAGETVHISLEDYTRGQILDRHLKNGAGLEKGYGLIYKPFVITGG